jgi:Ca-activated chloride channel family protein
MRLRSIFFLLLCSFGPVVLAAGQVKPTPTPEKEETIKVDTQLVDVPIAVSSAAGMPLRGLKASNFIIYEDGQKQDVVEFSATTAPFEVALVLDTSGSTRSDLALIQRAAAEFISSLRPGDRVSVTSFNTDRTETRAVAIAETLTLLTEDRKRLNMAVNAVRTSNGTPYYDALLQVAETVFKDKPGQEFRGRRAVVALTDGVDSTSSADFLLAKEALEQIGVMTFFIKVDTRDFFEANLTGDCETAMKFSTAQIRRYYRTIAAKPGMERTFDFCKLGDFEKLAISKRLYEVAEAEMTELAKASGGNVFPIADLNEARTAFKSVADEIGTKYTLAYYPKNEKKDGTYRKIRVELVGLPKGTQLRAREGYTAPRN